MKRAVPDGPTLIEVPGQPPPEDWLIADLHLTDEGDALAQHFVAWLGEVPLSAQLWILGDLFEYWLGKVHLASPGFTPILDALQKRTGAGGFTAVIPGNRDFLLGAAFRERTGVAIYPEGVRLQRGAVKWLLLHGDELCTRDRGYQRLRRVLRAGWVQATLRRLPAGRQHALARRLRRASKRAVPQKRPDIVAMQPEEALARLRTQGAERLVCGHAHGFREHEWEGGLRWWVLDAFGAGAHDLLRVAADGKLLWQASRAGAGFEAPS